MGLMEQMKKDIEQITTNKDEFALDIVMKSPTGETATIQGYHSDHSNSYDQDGVPITGKFTHVTISEQPLIDLGYPTRNAKNLVSLHDHLVTVNYADGTSKKYMVDEVRPDYTINLILLILNDYNGEN